MSSHPLTVPDADPAHFLKIAGQGASVSTHADLWRWLQGDVQQWLAHEVMLIGWGDFRCGELHHDIVSSLPGMRSHHWTAASISPFISYLRDCWAAAQQHPCQLDITGSTELVRHPGPAGVPLESISVMRSAVVHGLRAGPSGGERIFAALSTRETRPAGSTNALKLLLPFIDTALRRMPAAPVRRAPCETAQPARQSVPLAALSERERQIMRWVAMGKTNPEIGCILSISEFTVKNHMKSIFSKLDVTNRAQAVAKLTRITAHA
jgi:transcriptional regulator EpsA